MTRETILALDHLLTRLGALSGPDRDLDYDIAELMGWKQAKVAGNVVWLIPESNESGRVPRYTKFLHDAYNLALEIDPGHVAGASWEPGAASARINEEPVVQACNPAVALCIAALALRRKEYVTEYLARREDANANK